MQIKDLLAILKNCDPQAQVLMTCFNDEGLAGNKIIDDANVFAVFSKEEDEKEGVLYISNREWDDGAHKFSCLEKQTMQE